MAKKKYVKAVQREDTSWGAWLGAALVAIAFGLMLYFG